MTYTNLWLLQLLILPWLLCGHFLCFIFWILLLKTVTLIQIHGYMQQQTYFCCCTNQCTNIISSGSNWITHLRWSMSSPLFENVSRHTLHVNPCSILWRLMCTTRLLWRLKLWSQRGHLYCPKCTRECCTNCTQLLYIFPQTAHWNFCSSITFGCWSFRFFLCNIREL